MFRAFSGRPTARGLPARTARDEASSWNTVKQRFASGATAELGDRALKPFRDGYRWLAIIACFAYQQGSVRVAEFGA